MNSNLLTVKYPDLIKNEWDYSENEHENIDVNKITSGSGVKAWWHCDTCKGKYRMFVYRKTKGAKCPYCTGKKVLIGYNDLQTLYPKLIESSWDWIKNNNDGIYPTDYTPGSKKQTWWHCETCNGSYMMSIQLKTCKHPQGCPYCAGMRILAGFNDLQTLYPKLVSSEWDWVKNNGHGLKPYEVASKANIKAWWRCEAHGHSWNALISNRTELGRGCPYCTNQKVLPGFNDLQSKYPDLIASEWDYEKNDEQGLKPDGITYGSMAQAWWHCTDCKGHYEMAVNDKTSGNGCPYCAGTRVLAGFNDLASKYPDLVNSEWNWIENDEQGLKPDEITYGSSIKASWSCSKCKHKWQARIDKRTALMNPTGCPHCSHRISKQENQVSEYITDYISNYAMIHDVNITHTMFRSIKFKRIYELLHIDTEHVLSEGLQAHLLKEIDIYIPELNLAIEYDGDYWHSDEVMLSKTGLTNSEAHRIKQELCEQAGIDLIFITEHDWVHDTESVRKMIKDKINQCLLHCKH